MSGNFGTGKDQASGRWIVSVRELQTQRGSNGEDTQPNAPRPLERIADTEESRRLAERASPMVRSEGGVLVETSTLRESGESAGDEAIFELPSGHRLRVAQQQLKQPVPLEALTLGRPSDRYEVAENGAEIVYVDHAAPSAFQAILVNPDGTLINATLQTPQLQMGGVPEFTSQELGDLLLGHFGPQ